MEYYFPIRTSKDIDLQYGKIEMPCCEGKVKISDVIEAIRMATDDKISIIGIDEPERRRA